MVLKSSPILSSYETHVGRFSDSPMTTRGRGSPSISFRSEEVFQDATNWSSCLNSTLMTTENTVFLRL